MATQYNVKVTIDDKGVQRCVNIVKDSFVIGRAATADVTVAHDLISRQQVRITIENESVWVEDLGSSNGSWIDEFKLPLREKYQLKAGAILALGSKAGPLISIEAQERTVVVEIPKVSQTSSTMVMENMVPLKKVVNGPDSFPEMKRPVTQSAPVVAPIPAPPKKLAIVDPKIEARVAEKRMSVEKNVFDQIKTLMNMESEEIHLMALEDAKKIRQKADEEALSFIQKAKNQAAEKLKENEALIQKKLSSFNEAESHAHSRLESLKISYNELAANVEELKRSEATYQSNLSQLQREIQNEQERIQEERSQIAKERNKLAENKKNIEAEYRDLELEERKIRARIEVDTLEAKAKISQIYAAAEKAQNLKDTLEPEVHALKMQKDQVLNEINDAQMERKRVDFDLERLNKELGNATYNLEITRKDQEVTKKEIEQSKLSLVQLRDELEKRDKDTQYLYERTQKEAEDNLNSSKVEAQRLVDNAKTSSDEMISNAEKNLKKIVTQQEKTTAEFERVKVEMTRRVAAAQEEANKIILDSKVESDKIINLAGQEAVTIKVTAEKFAREKEAESNKLHDDAVKETVTIKDKANAYAQEKRKEADSMLHQLKVEIVNRQRDSLVALAETEEKQKVVEAKIVSLEAECEARIAEAHSKTAGIIEAAQREAHELKLKLEASIQDEIQKRKAESDALHAETQAQRQKLTAQLDAEFKEGKQKQQANLAELKQIELANIKELKKKAEEEIKANKQEKAKTIATSVYAMVGCEMYKARNKVMDETFIETFSNELKEMVVDIVLDRTGADSNRLQELLKTSENAKGKEKLYWKRMGIIGASAAFIVLLLIAFPSIISGPKNAIISAFTEQGPSQADEYVKSKVQEAKERMNFNPPTTPEYKVSYVDNILYTTDFATKRQAQAFQDKWILELNDYFINRLDVKDTTIIKFVSLEATLMKDLAKLKTQIDPQNTEPKFEEMRTREREFKDKLSVIFDDHDKVSKYYEYSAKFWNEFYHPRKPSH
jgi:hypothetical protein